MNRKIMMYEGLPTLMVAGTEIQGLEKNFSYLLIKGNFFRLNYK